MTPIRRRAADTPLRRSGGAGDRGAASRRPAAPVTPRSRGRRGLRWRRFRGTAHLLALLALIAPAPIVPEASGQEVPTSFDMVQAQREYEAVFAACDAAIKARDVEQEDYDRALARVNAAGRSGDDEAWEAANREFLQISRVMDEFQRRIRERCDAAEAARQAYLEILDRRRRGLETELAAGVTPSRRGDVLDLLDDIDSRYRELEEVAASLQTQFVMRPLIEIDARDTPDAVRNKAAYLERKVQQADSVIADLDREIERVESRIRTQRTRENFRAGLGRFDDTRTPVGSDPSEGDPSPAVAADSTALSGRTLEEKLRDFQAQRQQLQHYRDRMVEKAREFRAYLETIT